MKASIIRQILHHVENAPFEIEEKRESGVFFGYIVRLTNFEYQVFHTHSNPYNGLKVLRGGFAQKLIDDFEAGKPLPFEIETN